jgi:hypothetical protein
MSLFYGIAILAGLYYGGVHATEPQVVPPKPVAENPAWKNEHLDWEKQQAAFSKDMLRMTAATKAIDLLLHESARITQRISQEKKRHELAAAEAQALLKNTDAAKKSRMDVAHYQAVADHARLKDFQIGAVKRHQELMKLIDQLEVLAIQAKAANKAPY